MTDDFPPTNDIAPTGDVGCTSDELHCRAINEIERLRAALEKIAAMDEICVTDFDGVNGWAHQWIARAALPKG